MDYFEYKNSSLWCEEVPLKELALQHGTPLYVYSHRTLDRHYNVYDKALSGVEHLICYSVKANGNIALLKAIANMGGGADVVSGGELFRCMEAGVPAKRIVFSGVGKTIPEIEYAIRRKILMLNVESAAEYQKIADIAEATKTDVAIAVRLNPDVDPKTHPYISTGLKENKFGMSKEDALAVYKSAAKHDYVKPVGLALHIGSQLLDSKPFVDAFTIAVEFIRELRKLGISIRYLDGGGGLGVRYREETPPSPDAYGKAVLPLVRDLDLTLIIEPGRSLVGNAGVLIARVVGVKRSKEKAFVILDAGMNDLIRPALYNAEHEIVPVVMGRGEKIRADIVGPICESADTFVRDCDIEEPQEGDLFCIRTAGAYGFSMASQYNARPRPAEVLVSGKESFVIRTRESFDDLIRGETIPEFMNKDV